MGLNSAQVQELSPDNIETSISCLREEAIPDQTEDPTNSQIVNSNPSQTENPGRCQVDGSSLDQTPAKILKRTKNSIQDLPKQGRTNCRSQRPIKPMNLRANRYGYF